MYRDAWSSSCIGMHGAVHVLGCTEQFMHRDAWSCSCVGMYGAVHVKGGMEH